MENERVEYTILWFVENYSYCWHKNGEEINSPYFTADELENTSWRLYICPRRDEDESKGSLSLHLYRNPKDDGPEEVSLNYQLSILSEDGSSLVSKISKDRFKNDIAWGWSEFVQNKNILQDILTIRCRIWKGDGEVRKVPPICFRTRFAIENISFLHVVENFSTLERHQTMTIEIRRPHSKMGCGLSSTLYFTDIFCLEGEIIIEITPSDNNHLLSKRKISLLNSSGNMIVCCDEDNRFNYHRKNIKTLTLSLTRQEILKKKSEYLPDDKLFLLCECAFSTGLEFETFEETQNENTLTTLSLDSDSTTKLENNPKKVSTYPSAWEGIKALYANQRLTDVKLQTKTKSFPAHKIVLSARSPIFEAMLTNDMREKNTDCIQVDDLADDVVEKLLFFLYFDEVENLQCSTATQLYYVADKYQIGKLKELCSSFLVENLTTASACELLVLADTHSDSDLKKSVEDFILENEKTVYCSKEWQTLMETNPNLALKTMHLKFMKLGEGN